MAAPINTYNSSTNLSLGQVPQVDDEVLYTALLDIHNAIESLIKSSDNSSGGSVNVTVTLIAADYTVTANDGLILVDTTAGDITVTLPGVDSSTVGHTYEIKQITGTNETLVKGDGVDPVDDDTTGITIDLLEAIAVKNDGTKWWLNN